MEHKDLYAVFDSIESLFKGNKNFMKTQSGQFVIAFDDKSKELLGLDKDDKYVVRDDACWWADYENELTPDVSITYEALVETIRYALDNTDASFRDVPIEILYKDLKKEDTDYSKQDIDCPLKDFSNDYELRSLIALADYPADLSEQIYEARNADNWCLKAFKDFPKYNNRVFIKLSDYDKAVYRHKSGGVVPKYIVISKNPLDYFYASYGNSFQSCFALNSPMARWYGYVPFSATPESCMVYLSDGTVTDVSLLNGKKFHCPQMYLRCWGYANERGTLVVDKFYRSNDNYIKPMIDFMREKFGALFLRNEDDDDRIQRLWDDGKNIYKIWKKYDLLFYSDSLILNKGTNGVFFKYGRAHGDGESSMHETDRRWRDHNGNGIFTEYCKKVKDVVKDIDFNKLIELVDGVLCNPKVCPITNLFIQEGQDKHPLAKYFTKPVKNLAIVDYCDGKMWTKYAKGDSTYFLNTHQDGFTCKSDGDVFIRGQANKSELGMTLKQIKDFIKSKIEETAFDAVLMKIVEDDKVTCQVFRNIKREKENERLAKAV